MYTSVSASESESASESLSASESASASASEVHSGLGNLLQVASQKVIAVSKVIEPSDEKLADSGSQLTSAGARSAIALILHQIGPYLIANDSPTLLIWGDKDNIAPVRTGKLLASRIDQSQIEILPDVGHVPMKESPDAFVRAVVAFLEADNLSSAAQQTAISPKAPMIINCREKRVQQLSGHFSSLEIIDCSNLVIEDAAADHIRITNSNVHLIGVTVQNGIAAHQSNIILTGGTFSGAVAVHLDDATADIAGAFIEGSPHAIAADAGARVLFSATIIESAHYRGAVHGPVGLKGGEAL